MARTKDFDESEVLTPALPYDMRPAAAEACSLATSFGGRLEAFRQSLSEAGFDDGRNGFADFGHCRQPDIGGAEQHVGDAGAGDVDGLKAEVLDNAREQGVRRTRNRDGRTARQQVLQPPGIAHGPLAFPLCLPISSHMMGFMKRRRGDKDKRPAWASCCL